MKERNPARLEQLPLDQDHAEEDASDDAMLGGDPVQLVHPSVEHLHGPEEVAYEADELVVVCLVRDGRPYVKSFVEHYFSMGVKHLFFLDNNSTDGTVEALKEYNNVTVLRTALPYKEYKYLFKQYLIERFGKKDRWCLCADIDELFDYPYSDVVGLGSLLRYLNERSYTAVAAQMLDMFPEEPLSGSGAGNFPDEPLKERHRFYDVSDISRVSIKELPRLRNNMLDSDAIKTFSGGIRLPRLRNNTLESDEIELFYGGIRKTVFGDWTFNLTKFPLVFSDGRVKPIDGSSHWVDNARIADLTCVLFHYKFLDGYFYEQAVQAVREEQYHKNSARYKKSLQVLDRNPILRVKGESAGELRSVNELVENLFLVVSEDYMELVYDEERKKGAGRAAGEYEPEGRPVDEAGFRRAKARAEVQGLRAKRLERRLEALREQNRREVQKLRGQHQRRVERLTRRLAKTKNKNRALTHELRSMRASRIWRLINKLGGIRAKVLGRTSTKQNAP
jgi:hypothetical protein